MKKAKPRGKRAWRPVSVDWRDAMNNHCWRLSTLAGLLEACGRPLAPKLAEGIGCSVSHELDAIRALLDQLEEAR
jgi:hypothetical protein